MFHINDNGDVKVCAAIISKCPYTDHFKSEKEARAFYEENNQTFSKMSKKIVALDEKEFNKILELTEFSKIWNQQILDLKKDNPLFKYGTSNKSLENSIGNQMVNFLANNLGKGFTREQLELIQDKITNNTNLRKSNDVIQTVNKVEQKGLKRNKVLHNGKVLYGFYKLEYTEKYLISRVDKTDKNYSEIQELIVRKKYKDWAEEKYQKGHKDPNKPLANDNLVMQPASINRAYRDKYVFDDNGLPKYPTAIYLIDKLDEFYTQTEQKEFLRILIEKYGNVDKINYDD